MSSVLQNCHNPVWTKMITALDPGLGMHTPVFKSVSIMKEI